MKTIFKIEASFFDEGSVTYLAKDTEQETFEKELAECIKQSNYDPKDYVSLLGHHSNILELMEKKGYEEVRIETDRYMLEDDCPLPNSVYLSRWVRKREVIANGIGPRDTNNPSGKGEDTNGSTDDNTTSD